MACRYVGYCVGYSRERITQKCVAKSRTDRMSLLIDPQHSSNAELIRYLRSALS